MYKYSCPGVWWGQHTGLRNVYTDSQLQDSQAVKMAKEDIKNSSGLKDCDITLLVKYKLSIEPVKTYADITKIPFSETVKKTKIITLD